MSYDLYLKDSEGNVCETSTKREDGGTYVMGGTTRAELNITYNYAPFYYQVLGDGGIRTIYGKTGAESIPLLEKVVAELGTERYSGPIYDWTWDMRSVNPKKKELQAKYPDVIEDAMPTELIRICLNMRYIVPGHPYWKATPGNAGYAANILLEMARECPNGIWDGD